MSARSFVSQLQVAIEHLCSDPEIEAGLKQALSSWMTELIKRTHALTSNSRGEFLACSEFALLSR